MARGSRRQWVITPEVCDTSLHEVEDVLVRVRAKVRAYLFQTPEAGALVSANRHQLRSLSDIVGHSELSLAADGRSVSRSANADRCRWDGRSRRQRLGDDPDQTVSEQTGINHQQAA